MYNNFKMMAMCPFAATVFVLVMLNHMWLHLTKEAPATVGF